MICECEACADDAATAPIGYVCREDRLWDMAWDACWQDGADFE